MSCHLPDIVSQVSYVNCQMLVISCHLPLIVSSIVVVIVDIDYVNYHYL